MREILVEMKGHLDLLSPRELEVFRLLVLGHTNREIASILHLSIRTAESHRGSLQRKLGISARSELVRFALMSGFFASSPDDVLDDVASAS